MADLIHLTVQPKAGESLSQDQVDGLSRVAHGVTAEIRPDGSASFGFAADRYSPENARGNLEMAARMQLGPRWRTRYEISDA
jgi:hypothetical protein